MSTGHHPEPTANQNATQNRQPIRTRPRTSSQSERDPEPAANQNVTQNRQPIRTQPRTGSQSERDPEPAANQNTTQNRQPIRTRPSSQSEQPIRTHLLLLLFLHLCRPPLLRRLFLHRFRPLLVPVIKDGRPDAGGRREVASGGRRRVVRGRVPRLGAATRGHRLGGGGGATKQRFRCIKSAQRLGST